MNRFLSFAAIFVVAFMLSASLVLAGGMVLDAEDPVERVDGPEFSLADVAPDTVESGGEIEIGADEEGTVVIHAPMMAPVPNEVIDVIHEEHEPATAQADPITQLDRDLEPLVSALAADGHEVVVYDGMTGALDAELLDADGFMTVAPEALSLDEREAVHDFVDRDGHAVVATTPDDAGSVSTFLGQVGITQEPGFVYDVVENDRNYLHVVAEPSGDTSITADVSEAVLRGPAPLTTDDGIDGMTTVPSSEHSIDQETGSFDVVAETDNLVVLGDASFMAPEFADRGDNDVLISNIGTFLASGDAETEDPPDVDDATLIEPVDEYYAGLNMSDADRMEDAIHPDSDIVVPSEQDLEAMNETDISVTNLSVDEVLSDRAYVEATEVFTDPDTGETEEWDLIVEVRPEDDPEEDDWLVYDVLPA